MSEPIRSMLEVPQANNLRIHANRHGYKGIWRDDRKDRFCAAIYAGGMRRNLGDYETAEEAAIAYDEAARRLYGTSAYFNFPREGEKSVLSQQSIQNGTCKNGHPLASFGYYIDRKTGGKAQCRACNLAAARRLRKRKSGA